MAQKHVYCTSPSPPYLPLPPCRFYTAPSSPLDPRAPNSFLKSKIETQRIRNNVIRKTSTLSCPFKYIFSLRFCDQKTPFCVSVRVHRKHARFCYLEGGGEGELSSTFEAVHFPQSGGGLGAYAREKKPFLFRWYHRHHSLRGMTSKLCVYMRGGGRERVFSYLPPSPPRVFFFACGVESARGIGSTLFWKI